MDHAHARGGGGTQRETALEQLAYREHAVIHVAEPGRLALLRVVQPAAPVDDDVREPRVEARGAACANAARRAIS